MQIRNRDVADRVGVVESAVSMLRRNKRFPHIETMEKIERAYGWSVEAQFASRQDYGAAFETMLQDWYAKADR